MTSLDLKRTGVVAIICALIVVLAGAGPALGSDESGDYEETSTQTEGDASEHGKACPDHDRGKEAPEDESDEAEAEESGSDEAEESSSEEGDDRSDRGKGRKCGHRKAETEPAPAPSPTPTPTEDEGRAAQQPSDDKGSTEERTAPTRTETETRSTSSGNERTAAPVKPVAKAAASESVARVSERPAAPRPLPIGAPVGSVGGSIGGGFSGLGPAVFGAPGKVCPSGPWKGMPYTNIKDCGNAVLGTVLARTGPGGMLPVIAVGLGLVALGLTMLKRRHTA